MSPFALTIKGRSKMGPSFRWDDEQKQKRADYPSNRFSAVASASPIMRRNSVPMPG